MAVEGTWTLTIQTPMGPRDVQLDLKADGGTFSGTQGGRSGDNAIFDAAVDGDSLAWKVDFAGAAGEVVLEFKGQIDGDAISGDVAFGAMGSGAFSAVRA